MAYDLSIFTKLYGQAGNSSTALQNKFPFLCDLTTLSRTLNGHNIVENAQQNPNGYDNVEMAYRIIEWFDKYADYNTGKMPQTIKGKATDGLKWNQRGFWYLDGIYELEQDPGYGVQSATSTASFYVSPSNVTVADPTGPYDGKEVALISHHLYNYGPIDYITRTDLSTDGVYVPNVSSDNLYSVFFGKTVQGTTTDTSGNPTNYDDAYPFNLPSTTEKYMGFNARSFAYSVPNGTVTGYENLVGSPGVANLQSYASMMFKADTKITGKTQSLASGGVAPTYSIIVPFGGHLVIDPTTSLEDVPITNMFDNSGQQAFDGSEIIHQIALSGSDVFGTTLASVEPCNPNFYSEYAGNPTGMKFQVVSNTLQFDTRTPARGTAYYQFRGFPVYRFKIEYSLPSDPLTMLYQEVNIAFNHLKNWNMFLYDSIVTVNTTGSKIIGNATFTCGTVNPGGASVNFTAVQTCYDSYVTVDYSGRGYYNTFPSTTVSGGTWGRFTSSRTGYGKCVDGRIDESDINNPISTQLTVSVNAMLRPDRYIYTIANSWFTYTKSSKNYQRPWIGSDNTYENQGFGAQVFLDGNNRVDSVGGDSKSANTAFIQSSPGYVFTTDFYHPQRNPNGWKYSYSIYGTIGAILPTNIQDFLNDQKFYNLSAAVYEVAISGGRITSFNPISRLDGDGTSVSNGWDYYSEQDNITMTFVRNDAVSMPSNAVVPKAYYVTNGTATNGKGNQIIVDVNHEDYFSGYNLPEDAYLYAIAFREGAKAPSNSLNVYGNLDNNTVETADDRRLFPDFYPSTIKITSERPVLRSTTRSLIDNVRSTGAQRYSFTYSYPPMTKESAQELIAAFEQYRSGEKAFSIRLPKIGFKLLNSLIKGDTDYSTYIQIIGDTGDLGSTELKVDGLPPNTANVFTEGTYFKIDGDTKLYQIVRNATSNEYGEAVIRVEPGMKQDNSWKTLYLETYDYVWVVVRFADDALSYTTDGSGLYTLELNFVEALG